MKEFKFAKGVEIPMADGIHECYEVVERINSSDEKRSYSFLANISIERLPPLIERFIANLDEPCFFLLEVPTNQKEEEKLRKTDKDSFHSDVYYMDGCSKKELLKLFRTYEELLVHDGLSKFGFASHRSKDEIYIGKYKITNIFTSNGERIKKLLRDCGIEQEEKIKTVWNNFSEKAPGMCNILKINGKTIYDLIKLLEAAGLYFAERREE